MIAGIIAWVRKTVIQLKKYIWDNTYLNTLWSRTGGGHKFQFIQVYYIELAYSENKIVVAGAYSNGASSTDDLIEWEFKNFDFPGYYKLPLYGAGKFILFTTNTGGTLQNLKVLMDGTAEWINHEVNLSTGGRSFGCGIYAGGQFIVALEGTTYFTSTDGLTWIERSFPTGADWVGILYKNGRYLIFGDNWNVGLYSSDGITWNTTTLSPTSGYVSGVVSDIGYVLIKGTSASGSYSADGFSWTHFALPDRPVFLTDSRYKKIIYGAGLYLLILNKGYVYYTSTDLINWTPRTMDFPLYDERDIIFTQNKFIYAGFASGHYAGFTVGYSSGIVLQSHNGIDWYAEPEVTREHNDFCYANNKLVAVSYERRWSVGDLDGTVVNHYTSFIYNPRTVDRIATDGTLFVSVSFLGNVSFTSIDGFTWTVHPLPVTSNWSCFKYLNGVFVLIGGVKTLVSTDGVTWIEGTMPLDVNWVDAEYGNGLYLSVSDTYINDTQPYVCCYSTDALSWVAGTMPLQSAKSIAFGEGVFRVVGSASDTVASTTDGVIWSSLDLPSETSGFWKLIVYGHGFFVALNYSRGAISYLSEGVWTYQEYAAEAAYGSDKMRIIVSGDSFYTLNSQGLLTRMYFTEVLPPSPPILTGSLPFTAELTDSATVNTHDIQVVITQGQTLKFGTDTLTGASAVDDTFIRLLDPDGVEVAYNDDNSGRSSYLEYIAQVTGVYTLRVGCYSDSTCSGTVVWEVHN